MTDRQFPDADARRAIGKALDDTLVVEAAAGTGKTTELVRRILSVLSAGRATMTQVVAVTFTEKAAGELKLRLREDLERGRAAAADVEVRERLEQALETLEEAHVNTIHGFCAELLRERPVEARVDPMFTVLTEPQADRLYARAFDSWLQDSLQQPQEGLRRALRRSGGPSFFGDEPDGPIDRLRRAGRTLAESRDYPRPWARPPFDRLGEMERSIALLHRLADLTKEPASPRDPLYIDTDGVRRLSRQIRLEESFAPRAAAHETAEARRDFDGWEARLAGLTSDRGLRYTKKGSGYKFSKDVQRSAVLAARDALFEQLQEFKRRADADLAACLQQELAGATARYQELKQTTGALDFADLLSSARDLIKTHAGVRRHLQQKFVRIFVDEFQDTDPVQAEILLLLAADDPDVNEVDRVRPVPGKLFIVGDPKQAIYRFRGTDVGTYWQVSRQLGERGGRVLNLTTSYRSVPAIQRFVNTAFADAMQGDSRALQADYVPLAPYRESQGTQPAIVALPVPRPYGRGRMLKPTGKAIDESLPDAVGAFVAWLVDERNGWQVSERDASGAERRVPLQARHIALLFRRFTSFTEDVTRHYVDAIEARGIPHLLVGGKAFHGREEVETIRAALAAIEWPDDELSVFATLKGSLFALDDELLLEFRHRFGPFHPFRIPKELGGNSGSELALTAERTGHLVPIAQALRLLQQLHRRRNYRPVADTIGRLLDATRAHVGFILRQAGEQALANVLHVAELARQYEAGGGISFRGFIDELRDAAVSTQMGEAPILEEGSDGVRLMTVHKAKGLEFPVVILADMTCRLSRDDASRYLDASRGLCAVKIGGWAPHELHEHEAEEVARDQAEGVRLAYVAATRARDLLVVPALGDGPWEGGWLSPLNQALYPELTWRRTRAQAPGCPLFRSKDSVLQRPNDEAAGPVTVCPGLHSMPGAGGYSVVWWDPSILDLGAKPTFGVRRDDLIVKDVPKHVVADGRGRYDRWRLAREDARSAGAVPSVVTKPVGEWLAEDGVVPASVAVQPHMVELVRVGSIAAHDAQRPGGAAFGSLVHGVLADAPLDATRSQLESIAEHQARVLGRGTDAARVAAGIAERVLAHEILKRCRAADLRGRCRRETPVSLLIEGVLLEGIVDVAFEEDDGWIVVDYKTDRELEAAGEDRYRRQVAVYASAIAHATNTECRAVLLIV
jgi:ATP-dependent exoDNAse (exonuclease V) beta subunit